MAPRQIQVTSTLSGKKEPLTSLETGHIKIYACGVTVYDHCHIGHAMQAIFFDMIRRYLTFADWKVTYVRNYTDVDDKIIDRAKETGVSPRELSERIIASSQKDMAALDVLPADHEPKVSESIPEIIALIEDIIAEGAAYQTEDGDVYYRVRSKKDYGKLSNRKPDELKSGTRDVAIGQKEDPLDFALWKKDDVEGASWQSPWGVGRPGWHIECSAMAKKFLGKSFDIHGGGRDLVFPHHENEIAQSESGNKEPYASYWLHSGLLTINKQKMSKSLNNHITIADFLEKWPSEVLRLAYLQNHYVSNVDFNEGVFGSCAKRLLFFYETLLQLDALGEKGDLEGGLLEGHNPKGLVEEFHSNMSNDFGTPAALRDLLAAFKKARELTSLKKSAAKHNTAKAYASQLRQLFGVLGLLTKEPASFIEELKGKVLVTLDITQVEIDKAIEDRKKARSDKDFQKSDDIRDFLLEKGIVLMDTPNGTIWTLSFSE